MNFSKYSIDYLSPMTVFNTLVRWNISLLCLGCLPCHHANKTWVLNFYFLKVVAILKWLLQVQNNITYCFSFLFFCGWGGGGSDHIVSTCTCNNDDETASLRSCKCPSTLWLFFLLRWLQVLQIVQQCDSLPWKWTRISPTWIFWKSCTDKTQ